MKDRTMNNDDMDNLTTGIKTKADKMRVLERADYARADIARYLGVRYQQVRNTLEGDKRTGYVPEILAEQQSRKTNDPGDFDGLFHLMVKNKDGTVSLPSELISTISTDGGQLLAITINHGIYISSAKGMAARIAASFA